MPSTDHKKDQVTSIGANVRQNAGQRGVGTLVITPASNHQNGPINRPITTPIYHSSTYYAESCDAMTKQAEHGYMYSRIKTPNSVEVTTVIAELEGGAGAVVFPSGMAALTNTLMCFLRPGDHIVAGSPLYSGTQHIFTDYFTQFGIETSFVKAGGDINDYRKETRDTTRVYYGETMSNPMMHVLDLKGFGQLGKEMGVMTVVDCTFSTPINQKVLDYGVDVSVHSATKYLGGHCDILAGCSTLKHSAHYEKLKTWNAYFGSCQSPFDSVFLLRSLRTLPLRMQRHNENGMAIAKFLEGHPKVKKVFYPGLDSHPQRKLAEEIMTGFGGMISIELFDVEASKKFAESTKLFRLAVSLGGVESLIEHVTSMTHGDWTMSKEDREFHGISDTLVRLSVGIEDPEDLITDLEEALACT